MGPIPWIWISRAAQQPGKALHIAMAIWHLGSMNRSRTVPLSGKVLASLGVDRHSKYRGLNALEQANLVHVERHPGRNAIVTILDLTPNLVEEHDQRPQKNRGN